MANLDAIQIDSSYSQPSTSSGYSNRNLKEWGGSFNASKLKSLSSNIRNVSEEKDHNEEEAIGYSNYEPSCPPTQPAGGIQQTQNLPSDIGAAAVQAAFRPTNVNANKQDTNAQDTIKQDTNVQQKEYCHQSTRYSNYEPSCPPAQPTEGRRQTQNRSSDIGAAAVQTAFSQVDVNEEAPPSYYDAVHGDHKW